MTHELENGNPTPEAIRDVVELLDTLPKKFHIEMKDAFAHPCETVACVAGAYAIARGIKNSVGYEIGAKWLAEDMGFLTDTVPYSGLTDYADDALMCWAEDNPILWGNGQGRFMFYNPAAYAGSENDDITLDQVKQHWLGVANRIEALA